MGDRRKCRTYAASPAEPGGLPVMLGFLFLSSAIGGFDPNLVGTYKFDLALFSGDSRTPVADVNIVVNTAAVPGPIVGAGLPGLMMALGGLIAWRRRKAQAA